MVSQVDTVRRTASVFNLRNVLFFLCAIGAVVGVNLGNSFVLALVETWAVIVFIAWRQGRHLFDGLKAERIHHPRTFEQCEVDVRLRLQTSRVRPIYLLQVLDVFPPAARDRVGRLLREPFNSERDFEIHYQRVCSRRRGQYEIGPLTLHGSDPLGLFPITNTLPLFTGLVVYPQARELPRLQLLGQGTLFHVGQETTSRSGHSEEFISLRDYHPGDPPLHIHWPSSARHGRFIVKEFQETVTTEVVLFLDLYRLTQTGLGDQTSTESIIRAGASVAARAIELSHAVEVFALGEVIDHVPLGGGRQHLITILDRMALYRAHGLTPFVDAVESLAPLVRSGATVVLICGTTSLDLERLRKVIQYFILEGVRVLAIPVDERKYMKLASEQEKNFAEALSFDEMVQALWLTGAVVAPLQAGDVNRELNDFFGWQSFESSMAMSGAMAGDL